MRKLTAIRVQFIFIFIGFFWIFDFEQNSIIKSLVAGLLFVIGFELADYLKKKRSSK